MVAPIFNYLSGESAARGRSVSLARRSLAWRRPSRARRGLYNYVNIYSLLQESPASPRPAKRVTKARHTHIRPRKPVGRRTPNATERRERRGGSSAPGMNIECARAGPGAN
ncbi:hypothetical protein EVAR_43242_1 [Eumeta japonica]|uniref:Uncharacterized protein n=1 Tax=Eumeta variegata TaxID=151549 RepID=A0A4C1WVS5_EUMVA|nr:hypothetical protein EVAR_43242_1 [Eumeta japonica]